MEQTARFLAARVEELEAENSRLKTQANQLRDLPLFDVAWHLGLNLDSKSPNRWKGHGHTINIDGSSFYDFETSRGGGGAIDLVMHVRQSSFKSAVAWLSERYGTEEMLRAATHHARERALQIATEVPAPRFEPPQPDESRWQAVEHYLVNKRKLPSNLIQALHEAGLIYADCFSNAVFVMQTREREIIGAFKRGSKGGTNNRFMGYAKDTLRDKGWFFFQLGGEDGESAQRVVILKSPIDAISYAALNLPEKRTLYLVADSVRQLPPLDYLTDKEVVVAYDLNGDEKAREIKQHVPHALRQRPQGEDWNEDLRELKLLKFTQAVREYKPQQQPQPYKPQIELE